MSLIEHPSARLTALTSGSSIGSHQATRFVPFGLPLNRVGAVARHEQAGSRARPRRPRRREGGPPRAADCGRGRAPPSRVELDASAPELIAATTGAIRLCSQPSSSCSAERVGRPMLRPVDQLHRDVHQRHAVGDRVMHAEDHRRAALVFLDEVHRPERMVGIERLGGEFADEALERVLAAASRQADAADVVREVEIRVVAPEDAGGRALDQLAIAAVAEKALDDLGLDPLERRPALPASRRRRSS